MPARRRCLWSRRPACITCRRSFPQPPAADLQPLFGRWLSRRVASLDPVAAHMTTAPDCCLTEGALHGTVRAAFPRHGIGLFWEQSVAVSASPGRNDRPGVIDGATAPLSGHFGVSCRVCIGRSFRINTGGWHGRQSLGRWNSFSGCFHAARCYEANSSLLLGCSLQHTPV